MANRLSYDILIHVFNLFANEHVQLYNCCLVDHAFNDAASQVLYRKIRFSPQHRHVLNLKDRGTLEENPGLRSACSLHNARRVTELEISGFISTRPSPLFALGTTISSAIQLFPNLSKIVFTPTTFHDGLFLQALELLPRFHQLNELVVNTSCTNELTAPLLTKIEGLRKLTLHSPGRVILNALPNWLERLTSLYGLHLMDNCGSITPGVLKSILPHISGNLRELTLGLSYSLTDEDVFSFLAQLPLLESLRLQYYWQMRPPKTTPKLLRLKTFSVNYAPVSTRLEVIALCRWIKRVIMSSPIEHIHLIQDEGPRTVNIPFDNLLEHLVSKHATTLRTLDCRHAYVTADMIELLLEHCMGLEEMYLAARKQILDLFQKHARHLPNLHTAGFIIRNAKMKRAHVDDNMAQMILLNGPSSLRRLVVNGAAWAGAWVSRDDGNIIFDVQRILGSK